MHIFLTVAALRPIHLQDKVKLHQWCDETSKLFKIHLIHFHFQHCTLFHSNFWLLCPRGVKARHREQCNEPDTIWTLKSIWFLGFDFYILIGQEWLMLAMLQHMARSMQHPPSQLWHCFLGDTRSLAMKVWTPWKDIETDWLKLKHNLLPFFWDEIFEGMENTVRKCNV